MAADICKRSKISCRNKTGVTGVSRIKDSQKCRAHIMVSGINYYLGTFPTVKEAVTARKTAEERVQQGLSPQDQTQIREKAISCRNKTGVTGVSHIKDSQKCRAHIMVSGINYYLGTFSTVKEATQARKLAEERVQNGLPPKEGE